MPKRSKKSNKADKMIKVCPFCGGQWISPPSVSRDIMGGQVGGINYMICNSCNKEIIPLTIKEKNLDKFKEELKNEQNISPPTPQPVEKNILFSKKSSKAFALTYIIALIFFTIGSIFTSSLCFIIPAIFLILLIIYILKDDIMQFIKSNSKK